MVQVKSQNIIQEHFPNLPGSTPQLPTQLQYLLLSIPPPEQIVQLSTFPTNTILG